MNVHCSRKCSAALSSKLFTRQVRITILQTTQSPRHRHLALALLKPKHRPRQHNLLSGRLQRQPLKHHRLRPRPRPQPQRSPQQQPPPPPPPPLRFDRLQCRAGHQWKVGRFVSGFWSRSVYTHLSTGGVKAEPKMPVTTRSSYKRHVFFLPWVNVCSTG